MGMGAPPPTASWTPLKVDTPCHYDRGGRHDHPFEKEARQTCGMPEGCADPIIR